MRLLILFLAGFSVSFAQLTVPFKARYQGLVKGDVAVIANNIVNRVDYNNSSNEPYYNHTNKAQLNDEFNMDYIDVDNDEDTFSSSSAELFLDNPNNKRIIYAGLYWSATYKYNVGILKNDDKYIAQDSHRESFNAIKIKFPNKEEYIDIVGQTIFDGIKEKEFKDFAPYAVYADITEYVKKLPSLAGVYTVANVKATQGKIAGGVAAGWTIFFVYEDETMSEKFIKSQDGFAGITANPTDIAFVGFQIQEEKVTAKIACAALEGDNNLIGDQLYIGNNQTKIFTPLSSSIRKEGNFFNSCITIDDQYFLNRFPDSKNTLGYDTFLYTIPNQNNSLISKNSNESVLRFKSIGDKLFLFFTAFQVETKPSSTNDRAISNLDFKNQTVKIVPMNNDLLVDDTKTASAMNRIQKNKALGTDLIEINTFNSSSVPSGYYLLANIFKTEQKTQEFIYYLKGKKITADFFINPLNNYYYVYLRKLNNQKEAIELYTSKIGDTYKERIQIVLVNNDNNLVLNEVKPKKAEAGIVQKNTDKSIDKTAEGKEEKQEWIVQKNVDKSIDKVSEVKVDKQELAVKENQPQKDLSETQIATSNDDKYASKKGQSPMQIAKARTINDLHIANIPDAPKGYYIVANVFEVNENSSNFVKNLKNKGLSPKVLINTSNNYKYIYLKKADTEQEARNLLDSKIDNKYESKIWILSVNNIQ